ncbi:response regulator transcription factor [Stenotrophomonas indicatrix]|uniref:response regulator transcription factor n=1 Tax=Stenotrophomonas indicatrix TaxID=2045451 RepID=UPI0015DF0D93|nr:response regulator transcription factor [Stenotrophomonas indicatrix]MBA0098762.1 response regulator transcription factor [Stenotrophomonas indicatrix]
MSMPRIRVAIADDHAVIRMGVEAALDEMSSAQVVGAVADSTALLALLARESCDVLVTDFAMPGGSDGDGLQLLRVLAQRFPQLRVIVMTGLDQPAIIQALYASGFPRILSKADDSSHVPAAVQAAMANRRYLSPSIVPLLPARHTVTTQGVLSPREQEVIRLYLGGASINEIATQLGRRKQTISTQKTSAMRKLGAESDADLFRVAAELGLNDSSAAGR